MAKLDTALNLCIELGKILAETDEFKSMRQAEANLLHDEGARRMVEGLQAIQMQMQKRKLAGMELTEEDKKMMQEAEANAVQNSLVKASFEAHERFQGIMSLVSAKIREGIRGPEQIPDDVEENTEE